MAETGSLVRRGLRHPRIENAVYFVTWRRLKTQRELLGDERQVVVDVLRHFDRQRYDLFAYVVMNDHVHVVVSLRAERQLAETVRSWKSYVANRLQRDRQRAGGLWQRGFFERVVIDEQELIAKLEYVSNNPRKRWPSIESYPWVWVTDELPW
jgi:REP-associated tyrosine transposase